MTQLRPNLPTLLEQFVAANTTIIDANGIFPPHALSLSFTGALTVMALALVGPEGPQQAYCAVVKHLLEDRPRALVFGFDRYSKPDQGTELADLLSVQHWDGSHWHFGILEYQHEPRLVKPVDFKNGYWRAGLLYETREIFQIILAKLPRERWPAWATALFAEAHFYIGGKVDRPAESAPALRLRASAAAVNLDSNPMPIPSWMIIDAVRYCIGRMSYQVAETTEWLIAHWQELPVHVRHVVQGDVEHAFARDDQSRRRSSADFLSGPLGTDIDRRAWEQVRALWGGG